MPEEQLLDNETKKILQESFKILQQKVVLEFFTKEGENDRYNQLTGTLLKAFAELSDKIEVNFNSIGDEKANKYGITRSPTVMFSPERYKIRYTGAPIGEEGRSFIQTLLRVSLGESTLSTGSKEKLALLKEKRDVQVFVTLTCPFCPGEVLNAFKAAIERPDLISAECVEVTENLDLARQMDLGGVPMTIINGVLVAKGLQPEDLFIDDLLSMRKFSERQVSPCREAFGRRWIL